MAAPTRSQKALVQMELIVLAVSDVIHGIYGILHYATRGFLS